MKAVISQLGPIEPHPRRELLVLGVEEAFAALRAEPAGVHVHAFSHDWALIDRARNLAARCGVSHRLSVHHQDALASFRRAS